MTVHIVDVHPDLLGTYGDGGNAVVLAQRLRWRGHEAVVHRAYSGKPLPAQADIYCLGGGEDAPQASSAAALAAEGTLARAVQEGAVVLAVCAGFQIVGESFAVSDGSTRPGLGLIDVRSVRGTGRRAVGELLSRGRGTLGLLSGYENHGGITELGAGVTELGKVLVGVGNGERRDGGRPDGGRPDGGRHSGARRDGDQHSGARRDGDQHSGARRDGAVVGRVVGTYLHGPVLARNPALADQLLTWVVGALEPLEDTEVRQLRAQRLAAVSRSRLRRHLGRRQA